MSMDPFTKRIGQTRYVFLDHKLRKVNITGYVHEMMIENGIGVQSTKYRTDFPGFESVLVERTYESPEEFIKIAVKTKESAE